MINKTPTIQSYFFAKKGTNMNNIRISLTKSQLLTVIFNCININNINIMNPFIIV